MTVQNVIDLAKNGVLRNVGMNNDLDTIVGYVNLGLIELYKRFPLDVQETVIELQDGVEIYTLPSDCMWIVAAYDEVPEMSTDMVSEIPINEEDNPSSINTISWNKIQVPVTVTGAYISIIYVASPTLYTTADLGSVIPIPTQLVDALLNYMGYAAHSSINSDMDKENMVHYNRFEASCAKVKNEGMISNDDMSMKSRIFTRGFV